MRNSPVRVWPSCQERRDRTDDEGKRDEDRGARTEGGGGGTKKAGTEGSEGTREKCVGIEPCGRPIGSRNIALRKCAHTNTHTETIHVRELPVHVEAARTKPVHVCTMFRGHKEFQKESRAG